MKKNGLFQYPGGVEGLSTSPPSPRLTGDEANLLSYLVRKHPGKAMEHLSSKAMEEELRRRQCGKSTSI